MIVFLGMSPRCTHEASLSSSRVRQSSKRDLLIEGLRGARAQLACVRPCSANSAGCERSETNSCWVRGWRCRLTVQVCKTLPSTITWPPTAAPVFARVREACCPRGLCCFALRPRLAVFSRSVVVACFESGRHPCRPGTCRRHCFLRYQGLSPCVMRDLRQKSLIGVLPWSFLFQVLFGG